MPFLTYPLALIGAALIPALVGIYLLRNRLRRRDVSGLLFWKYAVSARESGTRLRRIQTPLLFFLELLVIILLVVAATDPSVYLEKTGKRLVVVLDDSVSMNAVFEGRTVRDRAVDALVSEIGKHRFASVLLIAAGAEPRLLCRFTRRGGMLGKQLENWKCNASDSNLDLAVERAYQLAGEHALVMLLTDHAPEPGEENRGLRWISLGHVVGNLAFTDAARSDAGGYDKCMLEIKNLSRTPVRTTCSIAVSDGRLLESRVLALAAGEVERVFVRLPPGSGEITATLPGDALSVDNTVHLLPPRKGAVKTRIAVRDETLRDLVTEALMASGLCDLHAGPADLVVADLDLPVPAACWRLRMVPAPEGKAWSGPFVLDRFHPLTDGVELQGAVWSADRQWDMDGSPVVMVGDVPLLVDRLNLSGTHDIGLQINPRLSTVQQTPDWPILFYNLARWRSEWLPGPRSANVRAGMSVGVVRRNASMKTSQIMPDGSSVDIPSGGRLVVMETAVPGVYGIVIGDRKYEIAANLCDTEESDLLGCTAGEWGRFHDSTTSEVSGSSLGWVGGLAALVLLVVHRLLTAGSRGVQS